MSSIYVTRAGVCAPALWGGGGPLLRVLLVDGHPGDRLAALALSDGDAVGRSHALGPGLFVLTLVGRDDLHFLAGVRLLARQRERGEAGLGIRRRCTDGDVAPVTARCRLGWRLRGAHRGGGRFRLRHLGRLLGAADGDLAAVVHVHRGGARGRHLRRLLLLPRVARGELALGLRDFGFGSLGALHSGVELALRGAGSNRGLLGRLGAALVAAQHVAEAQAEQGCENRADDGEHEVCLRLRQVSTGGVALGNRAVAFTGAIADLRAEFGDADDALVGIQPVVGDARDGARGGGCAGGRGHGVFPFLSLGLIADQPTTADPGGDDEKGNRTWLCFEYCYSWHLHA